VPRDGQVPRVGWAEFTEHHLVWHQGEHVSLIGPTGSGKTTLALAILPLRQYVIAFATKPKDATIDTLVRSKGWRLVRTWERMPSPANIRTGPARIVFWPKYATPDDEPRQAWEIGNAIRNAFVQGGWCLFVDEVWWFANKLGLGRWLESIWSQGRSIGLSLVAGTQRPAFVPLMMYDQATHCFFWRDNDERNLKRISGMNGLNAQLIRSTVAALATHEVLYVNTRTGAMVVTKAPARR
jgi:energy-coupling factor transporter ATP-binding protein EcfA2